MAGELELERNTQATARMLAAAAIVGAALFAAWGRAADTAFKWGLFERGKGPWGAFLIAGALGAVALAAVIIALRQPRGARITWDDWGVTEWDGDGVRTAIARERLRKQLNLTTGQNLAAPNPLARAVAGAVLAQGDLPGAAIGGHLVLSDDEGRRIDVTQGVQNVTLNRRLSTVSTLAALLHAVREAPNGAAKPMPSSENLLALGYVFGIAAYLAAGFALALTAFEPGAPIAWVAAPAAAVLLLLRSLPWWLRARALGEPDRGATKVTLDGAAGSALRLRDHGGATLTADLATLKHPDAALATRTGDAWVRRGPDGTVAALETAGARQARRSLASATRLEAALRTLLAVLVLVPAGPLIFGTLRELQGGVEGVTLVKRGGYGETGLHVDGASGLALVGRDFAGVFVLDLRDGHTVASLSNEECKRPLGAISPGGRWVVSSCSDHNGPYVVSEHHDGALAEVGRLEADLYEPEFAFDGPETLVVGDHVARVERYSLAPLERLGKMPYFSYSLRGITVSPVTHEVIFSGWSSDRPSKAQRWSGDGAPVALEQSDKTLGPVAFSADGKHLAAAVMGGAELYDEAGAKLAGVKLDIRGVAALAFSPDGETLAIATEASSYSAPNLVFFADVPSLKLKGSRNPRWRQSAFRYTDEQPAAIAWAPSGELYVVTKPGGLMRMTAP